MLRPSENGAVRIGWADYDEFLSENLVGYRGVVGFDCLRFVCFAICAGDESLRFVHFAAAVGIGGRAGGVVGGFFQAVFRIRADGLRAGGQYSGRIRGGSGGLSALYPEPAAGYGARMRRAVDVSSEGLAAV